LKETDVIKPVSTFVLLDEDPQSINDSMVLIDAENGRGLVDLPSRCTISVMGSILPMAMPQSSNSSIKASMAPGRLVERGRTMPIGSS